MINLDTFANQLDNCVFATSLQLFRKNPTADTYDYAFLFGFLLAASHYNQLTQDELNVLCDELDRLYVPEDFND